MIPQSPKVRRRARDIMAFVWLALISALAALDHVALTRAIHDEQEAADHDAIATLQSRLAAFDSRLDTVTRDPALSQASFALARDALDERLRRLEQGFNDTADADDVSLLNDRLKAIENRMARTPRTPPTPPIAAKPAAPTAGKSILLEPPFTIIGTELRGGVRFLSVAPLGATSLAQARVLRLGDSESNWRLDALEGRSADFTVDGQMQRIVLP